MLSRITQIRRRKIAIYQEALGAAPALETPAADFSDFDYVTQLSTVAQWAHAGLSLEVGSRRRLTDLGLLGHVIMSSRTLREALDIWLCYADMAGEPVKITSLIETENGKDAWKLQLTPLPFLSLPVADFLSDELCASFFAFARDITTRDLSVFKVELRHAAQMGADYARYFPGEISFGSDATRLVGPADILDAPVATRDPQPHSLLLDHFAAEARDHGLARATTTDSAILADHRRAYSLALIREGTLRTKQIAHALGFRNENSLRRAFRQWTGQPIGRRGTAFP